MAQDSNLIQAKQYNHQSNNPPPSMTSPPSLPGVVPCAPSKIVHGIDDSMQDVVVVAGRAPPRGRKQYMTRSMVAATAKVGQHAKTDVVVLYEGSDSAKVWPMAGNRLQGKHEGSVSPSSSL
jgi:hypothetical protein